MEQPGQTGSPDQTTIVRLEIMSLTGSARTTTIALVIRNALGTPRESCRRLQIEAASRARGGRAPPVVDVAKRKWTLSPSRLPRGMHFAWVIVSILAIVQIIGSSIGMAAGILIAPLYDPDGEFGWSLGTIGAALGLYYVVGAVFAPVSGALGDRYGARKMMVAGGLLYGTSMILLGFISELWHFFLMFGVALSITQSLSMVPLMAAVSGWFRRRLGLGIGILWGAGGVGTAILAPLLGYLLVHVGWSGTFWIIGGVGGGTILLLTLVFRSRPSDIGIRPYGATEDDDGGPVIDKSVAKTRLKVFNQHIRSTRAFWNLPLIHGLGCAGHGVVLIYSIPIAVDQGISLVQASVMITIIMLVSIISRFLTPVLAELYGTRKMMATSLLIQGVTVLFLFWAHDVRMFYLFSAFFGLGFGGEWTGYLVINRQYFGNGPMATCYGWQITGALLGHAVTMGLAGLVLYATGSYAPVLVLSMAFNFSGVLVIMMLEPTSQMLIPHWEESLPLEAQSGPTGAVQSAD